MKALFITLLLTLVSVSIAYADGREGNGRDVIICYNEPILDSDGNFNKNAKMRGKPELKDFWEGIQTIGGSKIDFGGPNLSYMEKVHYAIDRLATVDVYRANRFRERLKDNLFFNIISRGSIPEIDDAYMPIKPKKDIAKSSYCYDTQVAVQRRHLRPFEYKVLIDEEIFSVMSSDHQAGLILHELVYEEDITLAGAKVSNKARYFNYLICSDYIANLSDIKDGLSESYQSLTKKIGVLYKDRITRERSSDFAQKNMKVSSFIQDRNPTAFDAVIIPQKVTLGLPDEKGKMQNIDLMLVANSEVNYTSHIQLSLKRKNLKFNLRGLEFNMSDLTRIIWKHADKVDYRQKSEPDMFEFHASNIKVSYNGEDIEVNNILKLNISEHEDVYGNKSYSYILSGELLKSEVEFSWGKLATEDEVPHTVYYNKSLKPYRSVFITNKIKLISNKGLEYINPGKIKVNYSLANDSLKLSSMDIKSEEQKFLYGNHRFNVRVQNGGGVDFSKSGAVVNGAKKGVPGTILLDGVELAYYGLDSYSEVLSVSYLGEIELSRFYREYGRFVNQSFLLPFEIKKNTPGEWRGNINRINTKILLKPLQPVFKFSVHQPMGYDKPDTIIERFSFGVGSSQLYENNGFSYGQSLNDVTFYKSEAQIKYKTKVCSKKRRHAKDILHRHDYVWEETTMTPTVDMRVYKDGDDWYQDFNLSQSQDEIMFETVDGPVEFKCSGDCTYRIIRNEKTLDILSVEKIEEK